MVNIKLRGILVHDLESMLYNLLGRFFFLFFCLGKLLEEELTNSTFAYRPLIYGQCCAKLLVPSNLDGIQHIESKVLTVVGDEVVTLPFFSHIVDDHFTCVQRKFWLNLPLFPWKKNTLTSLSQCLIVQSSLANLVGGPFSMGLLAVDIDDIEILILWFASVKT